MNPDQIKIQKTSKAIAACLKIIRIALFVAITIQISAIVWFVAAPEGATKIGNIHVLSPIADIIQTDGLHAELIAQFAANVLKQGIIITMLFLAGAIFTDISKEHTPFSAKHITQLKVISLLMLAMTIFPPPTQMLLTMILAPGAKASASFGLFNFIFVVIFYCLAQIFDYGRILQQQSDETL